MELQGLHCFVSGRVQGVFYRANTQYKAVELGLSGWVRNLSDGRVEVLAFGTAEQLNDLRTWLWQGPPISQVTQVECVSIPWEEYVGFKVR